MTDSQIGLLRQLLSSRTNQRVERAILTLLQRASTEELNLMLADPKLTDRLVGSLNDRWFGDDCLSELFDLLGTTRRAELDLPARAAVIHALQTGHTGARDELIIRDLFLDVGGADLTVLKNLIDATPNHHDLEELVFGDIDAVPVRQAILDHIAEQAATITDLEAKVLSDIDDTTICSLHDRRFPKGIIYPGVLALWAALDQGPHDMPRSLGDLTFITARPGDLLGWIENSTRRRLQAQGVGVSSMLTGSLIHLLSRAGMADKKIQNITNYHQLFPEYRLVFIGDSGQGDVLVAQRLLSEFDKVVDAVLIHDVVDTDESARAKYADEGVFFFDTYVGAALRVHELGLIADEGLAAVAAATQTGFDAIEWSDETQERRARELLARDLQRVRPTTETR